jgi:hypothetical protein
VRRAAPDGLLPRAALGGAAVNHINAYELDVAEAWLARIFDELRELGLPVAWTQASNILGMCLRLRGDLPAAERRLREAYAAAIEMQLGFDRVVGAELALLLVDAGRAAEAGAVLAACDPPGPVPERMLDNVRLLARARVAEAEHRDDEAIAGLLELGRRLRGWGLERPVPPWRSTAARLLAARGEGDRARRLAGEELAAARRWGRREVLGIALRGTALVAVPVDLAALEASISGSTVASRSSSSPARSSSWGPLDAAGASAAPRASRSSAAWSSRTGVEPRGSPSAPGQSCARPARGRAASSAPGRRH